MQIIFDLFFELEFYIKIAMSCAILQQFLYWVLLKSWLGLLSVMRTTWKVIVRCLYFSLHPIFTICITPALRETMVFMDFGTGYLIL